MPAAVALDRQSIAAACAQYGVARLRVFGSAATGRFRADDSDLDFIVDFAVDAPRGIGPFLELKQELERITGRSVDLVEARAVRNPYFARRAFDEAVDVYAA